MGAISHGPLVAEGIVIMATKASEIAIQTPCHLDWSKMTPAEGGRFCGDCKKVVRDLSKMTEREARALVAKERYEGLCVRMLVDRDGNVFFGGDKLISASLLSKAKRTAMAAAAIALPLVSNACTVFEDPLEANQEEELAPLMGGVSAPNDPPVVVQNEDAGADAQTSDAQPDGGSDAAPDVIIYK
jgi:hypothetical protein